MGGKSSSSSSSNSATTTTNIDRRQVVAEGALGIASDGATINIQELDNEIVQSALETVKANDATNGAGFTQLLTLADKLFTGAGEVINKTQDTTIKQIDQINTAANDQGGKIDQKTLLIVAGAALAAMALRK
ncbi:hypothetical protein MCERHM31_00803 [Methylophilaceae bacterium]